MNNKELISVLQTLIREGAICKTEKEALKQMLKILESDNKDFARGYESALSDVEELIAKHPASVSHGKLLYVPELVWVDAINHLRNEVT